VAFNTRDDVSFRRIINTPTRGIGNTAMGMIEKLANDRGISLWEAIQDQEMQSGMQKKAASSVRGFIAMMNDAQDLAERGPVTPILKHLLADSG
jgi:DNA helicase-2/ATP-dependent DNA helicase PcrA